GGAAEVAVRRDHACAFTVAVVAVAGGRELAAAVSVRRRRRGQVAARVVAELGDDAVRVDRQARKRAGGRACGAGVGVRAERDRLTGVELVGGARLARARGSWLVVARRRPDRVAGGVVEAVADVLRRRRRRRRDGRGAGGDRGRRRERAAAGSRERQRRANLLVE